MMNTYSKKKSKLNAHKMARNTINLNKFNGMQTMYHTNYDIENSLLTAHWSEYLTELKSEGIEINTILLKKVKFIIKWWEN